MINRQFYVDEDLRENFFKGVGTLTNLRSGLEEVNNEPSAQDLIDEAVPRNYREWAEEMQLRGDEW